nr:MAG TPA: hypothetical protein [Caudoviricetes sp.]
MNNHIIIMDAFTRVLEAVLNPGVLTVIITLYGLVRSGFKILTKNINAKQDEMLEVLTERMDKIEQRQAEFEKTISRDVLRQEFNYAIDSDDITEKELYDIYDRYLEKGGNSYATRRMQRYMSDADARARKTRKGDH